MEEKIDALQLAPQRHKRQLSLALKYITLWSFTSLYFSTHFSCMVKKNGKIDFSNNPIVEIKKKMTFQGVFMYKQL